MTEKEIADEFGCGSGTVHRWLSHFGIKRRKQAHKRSKSNGDLSYSYIWWRKDGDWDRIRVHRLVAYAHGMLDSKELFDESIHVHHKNGIAWINHPDNLEALSASEHMSLHFGRGKS